MNDYLPISPVLLVLLAFFVGLMLFLFVVGKDAKGRYLSSREVLVSVNQPIKTASPGGRARRFLQVRGLFDPDLAVRVHNIELYPKGRWFSDTGLQKGKVDGKNRTLYEVV